MDKQELPIGVFDSGVGGLTVAREIFRNLPNEKIIYYGDTARLPYGNKSKETIIRYSRQIAGFLISRNVKAIVIACNTASALALDSVCDYVNVPVLGVVGPGADAAIRATKTKRIGIIGTESTVKSDLYSKYIKAILSDAEVFSRACPLFVSLVEEGMIDDPVTIEMIHRYLDEMISEDKIDSLILGCTHYPLLRKVIEREIGENITLVNPAYETSVDLKKMLEEKNLKSKKSGSVKMQEHEFFVSDAAEKFRAFASTILGFDIEKINLKPLDKS